MPSSDQNGPFFLPLRGAPAQSQPSAPAKSARTVNDASGLSLVRASRNSEGEWSSDDYDVFAGTQHVGRIVLATQGPQGMPWFWEITARPESTQNHGHAVSRDQALKELTARWANPARF